MTTCENVRIGRSDAKLICNKTKHIHQQIRLFRLPTEKKIIKNFLSWIFSTIQSHYRKYSEWEKKTFFLSHSVNFSFIFFLSSIETVWHTKSRIKMAFFALRCDPTHKNTRVMNWTNTHRVLNIHWAQIRVTCIVEVCDDRANSVSLPLIFDITKKWHYLQQ